MGDIIRHPIPAGDDDALSTFCMSATCLSVYDMNMTILLKSNSKRGPFLLLF